MAYFFVKMKCKLYDFHKDSGLEVNFVMRRQGEYVLAEVKAVTGNTKIAKQF